MKINLLNWKSRFHRLSILEHKNKVHSEVLNFVNEMTEINSKLINLNKKDYENKSKNCRFQFRTDRS